MANSKNNQNTDTQNTNTENNTNKNADTEAFSTTATGATSKSHKDQEVEVLYQKLGGQWYAFSMIDDEVFMAPVAEEKIDEIRRENDDVAA